MPVRTHTEAGTVSTAVYAPCERYRYSLTRVWTPAAPRLMFVMLNPSTASELHNDPTVERCERRARALGFGGFRVTNIFAWRATRPRDLKQARDPVGPANDAHLVEGAAWADRIVAAWGVHGAHRGRGAAVARKLRAAGHGLHHLGLTRDGHPRHPLYVAYRTGPMPWTEPETNP
jgi:hypothetical protein